MRAEESNDGSQEVVSIQEVQFQKIFDIQGGQLEKVRLEEEQHQSSRGIQEVLSEEEVTGEARLRQA